MITSWVERFGLGLVLREPSAKVEHQLGGRWQATRSDSRRKPLQFATPHEHNWITLGCIPAFAIANVPILSTLTTRVHGQLFWLTSAAKQLNVEPMIEYVVTKQGATADWGSNAEGEVQEMPLSMPDGAGWRLHSVIPGQYNVMAVWERETETKRKRRSA